MEGGRVERSASTWKQPIPPTASPHRADVLAAVAATVARLGRRRVRVAVDGLTAAGKTTFADELAATLAEQGRVVLRASLDDFKRPWREAHLYDRTSGEGYYRNAFDLEAGHWAPPEVAAGGPNCRAIAGANDGGVAAGRA